jgi:pimeloyl-ACP methyl ester carboxylesterase
MVRVHAGQPPHFFPGRTRVPTRSLPSMVSCSVLLRIAALAVVALMPVVLGGCAAVGVKIKHPSPRAQQAEVLQIAQENNHDAASQWLVYAGQRRLAPADKLAALLTAAQLTSSASPGTPAHRTNQAAIREIVSQLQATNFEAVTLPDGRQLTTAGESKKTLDPRTTDDLVPASAIRIRKLRVLTTLDGAGVPYVAHFGPRSPALRGQAGIPPRAGICDPVTAVVRVERGAPQLVFYRTRVADHAIIDGNPTPLAADFSAPLAYLLSQGANRSIDIRALLRSDKNIEHAGLYQFGRFDPDKIPIVLVHGLMARPETWVPTVNELLADKEIRERYQFWFFLYPTGLPVWASAAKLRSELDRFRQTFDPERRNRNLDRMVLAGHSMGGLLSSLQIRTGGQHLWQQFMDTPPDQLNISPELKAHIIRIMEFQPRPEIRRVVFFATPHRGSDLAVNPFSEFASRLIRLPFSLGKSDLRNIRQALHGEARDLFVAPANSLVFLRANSPLLKAILKLPQQQNIPYHSIIGDRGQGDTPDSSDGVVPYWSSHLAGATSEKIIPSSHGTNSHPEGIEEFRRILRQHLTQR